MGDVDPRERLRPRVAVEDDGNPWFWSFLLLLALGAVVAFLYTRQGSGAAVKSEPAVPLASPKHGHRHTKESDEARTRTSPTDEGETTDDSGTP